MCNGVKYVITLHVFITFLPIVSMHTPVAPDDKLALKEKYIAMSIYQKDNKALTDILFSGLPISCTTSSAHGVWWLSAVGCGQDNTMKVSGSDSRTIKWWTIKEYKNVHTLPNCTDCVSALCFSPDGTMLASASKQITLWDLQTSQKIKFLKGHLYTVSTIDFNSDGTMLASGSNKEIKIWNVQTGTCNQTLTGHDGLIFSVKFSPDNKRLVSSASDKSIRFWVLESGLWASKASGLESSKSNIQDDVYRVCFNQDGTLLASTYGAVIKLWDMISNYSRTLSGHTGNVLSILFGQDILVSSSVDKLIKIWNPKTGACIITLSGHTDIVPTVGLSADGTTLVSVACDNSVKLWDLRPLKDARRTLLSLSVDKINSLCKKCVENEPDAIAEFMALHNPSFCCVM